jgi:hypothetical protein
MLNSVQKLTNACGGRLEAIAATVERPPLHSMRR